MPSALYLNWWTLLGMVVFATVGVTCVSLGAYKLQDAVTNPYSASDAHEAHQAARNYCEANRCLRDANCTDLNLWLEWHAGQGTVIRLSCYEQCVKSKTCPDEAKPSCVKGCADVWTWWSYITAHVGTISNQVTRGAALLATGVLELILAVFLLMAFCSPQTCVCCEYNTDSSDESVDEDE